MIQWIQYGFTNSITPDLTVTKKLREEKENINIKNGRMWTFPTQFSITPVVITESYIYYTGNLINGYTRIDVSKLNCIWYNIYGDGIYEELNNIKAIAIGRV